MPPYTLKYQLPQGDTTYNELDHHTSIINQEYDPQTCPQGNVMEIFFN